jgi:hypothetical protein
VEQRLGTLWGRRVRDQPWQPQENGKQCPSF